MGSSLVGHRLAREVTPYASRGLPVGRPSDQMLCWLIDSRPAQPASVTVHLSEYGRNRFGNVPKVNQLEVVVAEVSIVDRVIDPMTGVVTDTPAPLSRTTT